MQMNQNEESGDLQVDDEDGKQELDNNNEEVIEMSSEEDANENDEEDATENQNQEENELEEEEEDELEEEEQDDVDVDVYADEDVSPKTTELIRQQIEEAMQIASELGKKAREELSQKYYETIIEATGAEPTQEQINTIFHRMQEQLSEEAQEELFDDCDDADAHDSINAASQILAVLNNMTEEERKDAFQKAKDILPEETQIEAKQQYIDISGREPNEQEYEEVIITLAQTKFTDAYFGNDAQNQNNDINKNGVEEVDDDYDNEKDYEVNENEKEEEEENLDEKCERLENLKQDVADELLQKSLEAFERKTGRTPNVDEQLFNIKFLLGVKKVNSQSSDDVENNNNNNNNDNNDKDVSCEDVIENAPVDQLL